MPVYARAIDHSGDVQSDLLLPTSKKIKLTEDGGIAVLMVNKSGASTVKGLLVQLLSTRNLSVQAIVKDVPAPIGVFLDDGIPDGSPAWVVISGVAYVLYVGNVTAGHLARGFLTSDGASYIPGYALSEPFPSSPFASDKHFYEIGHTAESRTGAGLALTILHFN